MKKKSAYRNHRPKRIHRTRLYHRPETLEDRIAREMMASIRRNIETSFMMVSPPCQHQSQTYTVNQVLGDQKLP